MNSPRTATLHGSPQSNQPPPTRPRRGLRQPPPLKASIKQAVTEEEKIGKRRHSKAYLMLDGSVENMSASGEVRAIAGKCKVLKTSLTLVTDACKEHRRCEDFTVEYLCKFLRKCKELSAVFLPHIKDSIRWEEVLEGEYLMDEALEKKLWEVENEGCKFCFVEYMLSYKSRYLWLLVLRHLGMEKEYNRSMACLKSMKENVGYIGRWVDEVMISVSGKENVA
jgi:hypothetical protein